MTEAVIGLHLTKIPLKNTNISMLTVLTTQKKIMNKCCNAVALFSSNQTIVTYIRIYFLFSNSMLRYTVTVVLQNN